MIVSIWTISFLDRLVLLNIYAHYLHSEIFENDPNSIDERKSSTSMFTDRFGQTKFRCVLAVFINCIINAFLSVHFAPIFLLQYDITFDQIDQFEWYECHWKYLEVMKWNEIFWGTMTKQPLKSVAWPKRYDFLTFKWSPFGALLLRTNRFSINVNASVFFQKNEIQTSVISWTIVEPRKYSNKSYGNSYKNRAENVCV